MKRKRQCGCPAIALLSFRETKLWPEAGSISDGLTMPSPMLTRRVKICSILDVLFNVANDFAASDRQHGFEFLKRKAGLQSLDAAIGKRDDRFTG